MFNSILCYLHVHSLCGNTENTQVEHTELMGDKESALTVLEAAACFLKVYTNAYTSA